MPTIKTKKEMNLPELIEYIAETEYKTESYTSNDNGAVLGVGLLKGIFINGTIFPNHTFTVEIEEEITEDTEIPKLYMRHNNDHIDECYGMSISKFDKSRVKAFYVPNDDKTMTLIWTKDEGLVE